MSYHNWPTWRQAKEIIVPGYYIPTLTVDHEVMSRVIFIADKKDKILKKPGFMFFGPVPKP